MRQLFVGWIFLFLGPVAATGLSVAHSAEGESKSVSGNAEKLDYFERHIRPAFIEYCYECHSQNASSVEGELRLDDRESLITGGISGPAIVPGDPSKSLLIKALRHQDIEMPPDRRLGEDLVRHFERWIADGAVDPRVSATGPAPTRTGIDVSEARSFWSFRPPVPQELPEVRDRSWPRNRIDYFILASLEGQGMRPAPQADWNTLRRRLAIDLTGLPATMATPEQHSQDLNVSAVERWTETLLNSPQFGENWARLWLDLARYAEDQAHIVGNDRSLCYPNAYRYRDWVVASFNEDLAYDRFIVQQIAADLFPADQSDLSSLGFLGLGPKYYNRGSQEVMADEWEDRVDVVTRGLLGLTVACARCHDHKYDPIPTDDYYALAGVFASTAMFNKPVSDASEKKESGDAKNPDDALHIVRDATSTDLHVMLRGDVKRRGGLAPRRFLQSIAPEESFPWQLAERSGRRELAEAIVDRSNPLTARVFVNRVWGRMMGQYLVATPSNFGKLGSPPTHPELLDDLAVRFMQADWSLKWLIREIANSATYRQSSQVSDAELNRDPDNLRYARMNRKKLPVEVWRDSILQAAGKLDLQIGGPSINPQDPTAGRRTLYSEVSRLELNKMLSLFDFPDPNAHAERRQRTTTALQKLFVLNSPFMLENASALARRVQLEAANANAGAAQASDRNLALVQSAVRLTLQRDPTKDECEFFGEYLRSGQANAAEGSLVQLCHVLLASNELAFVD